MTTLRITKAKACTDRQEKAENRGKTRGRRGKRREESAADRCAGRGRRPLGLPGLRLGRLWLYSSYAALPPLPANATTRSAWGAVREAGIEGNVAVAWHGRERGGGGAFASSSRRESERGL